MASRESLDWRISIPSRSYSISPGDWGAYVHHKSRKQSDYQLDDTALESYVQAAVELGFNDIESAAQQLMLSFRWILKNLVCRGVYYYRAPQWDWRCQSRLGSSRISKGGECRLLCTTKSNRCRRRSRDHVRSIGIPCQIWFWNLFHCAARGRPLYGEDDVDPRR